MAMSTLYLFDTSAFQASSIKTLDAALLQNQHLYASPYCFWELLSHLDEQDSFDAYKSRLMKFKYFQILDDPHAEIETVLLNEDRELQDRVPDHDLIEASLAAIRASSSLNAFYSSYIQDSKGRLHQISDCAANTRKALEEAEEHHVDFIRKVINSLYEGQVSIEADSDRDQAILDLVEGWAITLKQRRASDDGLRDRLINDTYAYCSYVLHRALKYFRNNNKVNLDRNDYEDGRICLHLKLDSPYYLVTNDKGMKEALDETFRLLQRLDDSRSRTKLQAINWASFQNIVMPG